MAANADLEADLWLRNLRRATLTDYDSRDNLKLLAARAALFNMPREDQVQIATACQHLSDDIGRQMGPVVSFEVFIAVGEFIQRCRS